MGGVANGKESASFLLLGSATLVDTSINRISVSVSISSRIRSRISNSFSHQTPKYF
jgi:hypothetical protein